MEYIKTFDEYIDEAYLKSGKNPLYHWTYSYNLNLILDSDSLNMRSNPMDIGIRGISFTRSITYDYTKIKTDIDVRLVFDYDKLSYIYNITPYDYFSYYKDEDNTKSNYKKRNYYSKKPYESEELITEEKIPYIGKYLKEIQYLSMESFLKTEEYVILYKVKYPNIKTYILEKNLITKYGI